MSGANARSPVGKADNAHLREPAIRWTAVNGLRIYARVPWPGGRYATTPIVLVHGLGVASPYLMPLAHALASNYPVYVPDLPGFGRSQKPRRPLDLLELADALAGASGAAGVA